MSVLACDGRCGRQAGFTNIGGPEPDKQLWVCGTCRLPTKEWLLAQGDAMLNYFRGGHLDGQAYETADLLSHAGVTLRIDQYRWTYETITSRINGRTARVWEHKETYPDSTAHTYDGPEASASRAEEATAEPQQQLPTEGEQDMSTKKKTATVEERRKALGLGRDKLAAEAGISASQLWRLEQGGNTKEGTAGAVEATLARLETVPASDPS